MMNAGFSINVSQDNTKIESFISKDFDNFHFKSEEIEILFEGVIFNKKQLINSFSAKDFHQLVLDLYKRQKGNFISNFEGEFRGFLWDKLENKLFVYTNQTATQRVFYYKDDNVILIDTSLIRLNNSLKAKNIKRKANIQALYELLTFKVMLNNKTAIENVFKIPDGSFLEISNNNLLIRSYYNLNEVEIFKKSKNDAYREVHEIFSEAIRSEYEKDDELNSEHFSNLSGGLDCRISMFYAIQQGYAPDRVFCFSEKNYADEVISKQIAADYKIPYHVVDFDNFDFIKNVDELTSISEGTSFFLGAIHAEHAYTKLNLEKVKLVHTGQIGGAILGSFNKKSNDIEENLPLLYTNYSLFSKIEKEFEEISKKYSGYNIFMLENYGFGYTVIGSQVINRFAYQASGFMNPDFMKLVASLPHEWKYYSKFYIEWINTYCKEATKYKWERTFMKPDATWKTLFGDHVIRRGKNLFYNKLLNKGHKFSMVPYDYYYYSRQELQNYYQNYFSMNIDKVDKYPDLKKEVETLFMSTDFSHKALSINVLAIFKLFFDE